jgi:hypothetical protein
MHNICIGGGPILLRKKQPWCGVPNTPSALPRGSDTQPVLFPRSLLEKLRRFCWQNNMKALHIMLDIEISNGLAAIAANRYLME